MLQNYLSAQEKFDIKFGKVSKEDFDLSAHAFDTSAGAVYIADKGFTDFEGDRDWLKMIFKRQVRIKVLNKNGFDAANFEIPFYYYVYGDYKLEKLQAVTYNLEGGKVKQEKLDEKSIYDVKLDRNTSLKRFTLPAVKEGSIIEVSYTIQTKYFTNLYPWTFQGRYPRIWSEYQVRIPGFLDYIFLAHGAHNKYHINTQTVGTKTFLIIDDIGTAGDKSYTLESPVINARWVMKDVPGLQTKPYVTSVNNYLSSIRFQLSEIKEPYEPKKFLTSWNTFCDSLLKRADFGGAINAYNDWLTDDLRNITAGAGTALQKANRIYTHVRNNFTCTQDGFTLTNSLKNVYKNRNGSVGDINLLLIAMLRNQGITAEPVILSTRDHGFVNGDYPIEQSFNYVVASVDVGGKRLFMDASTPGLAFGRLPLNCYNGHARLVSSKSPEIFNFNTDTLREAKVTSVIIGVDGNGRLAGTYGSKPGYYESLDLRRQVIKKSKDELMQSIKKKYPSGIELSALEIDSLNNYDQPIQIRYNIDGEAFKEDIVYFNPMLSEAITDNYFKASQRLYPVEMPHVSDEMYVFSMDIPAGYEVEELPESVKISLNKDDGSFEYLISKSATTVNLRSRIKLNRATFVPEEYEVLRNFFAQIVKKHGEQIVFKRKK